MWKIFGKYKKTIYTIKSILKKIVPIAIRKKIKSFVEAKLFTEQINNVIPPDVLNEWQNWNYGPRKDDSIDFINFSVIAWDFRFQRPQQLAKKLGSSNHRVFYIKNEFIPYTKTKSVFAPIKVEKKAKNVYEITLSATRNLFIYNDIPSEKDKKIILASIKNLINQAQIVNPIAKFDHPFWAYILEQLAMPSIYDCMDNHQGFLENAKHLSVLENKLLNNSNITLVTSKFLQKIATKNKAQNITLLPNAGDYQHFSEAADKSLKIPSDLSNIPHPIIGYYGALAEWFDTNILESVANKHSDKSIVLIGNVTNSKIESLSKKYKNIYLLGEKPYSELPSYLQEFDVCTIPFILSDLIKATHPVKIFEYLAAGKPVVATKMPEILEMQNIYFANQKDFSSQISTALLDKNKDIKKRQTIAKNNTWNIRSSDLISITNKILFPKISIVLLSYNNPEMVKNTIDSILTRTFYPNYELIIVDNKSDQKTIEVLYSYQSISQVKLIFNQENYGFAKGNNIGMKEARGDYLVLINNDVIVTPGWLSRLLYHIKPGIGLVGPVTNSIGNEAKINILYNSFDIKDLESKASVYTSSHWGNILKLNRIAAFCWIMSRSTYQQFGGLDEQYGRGLFEDDDYCLNLKKNDLQILCAEDVFIHHFGGASFKKIQNDEYYKLFNENKLKFEKKWKTKWVPHQYRK
jgi:GT2 family glycosyltransferase